MKKLSRKINEAKLIKESKSDYLHVFHMVDDADSSLSKTQKINWSGGGYVLAIFETGGRDGAIHLHFVKDLDTKSVRLRELIEDWGAEETDMSSKRDVSMDIMPDSAELVKLPNNKLSEVEIDLEESTFTIS